MIHCEAVSRLLVFVASSPNTRVHTYVHIYIYIIYVYVYIYTHTRVYVCRYMVKRNRYLYPMGKSRFEPLATVIIAAVMATAAIEIISKAIQEMVCG